MIIIVRGLETPKGARIECKPNTGNATMGHVALTEIAAFAERVKLFVRVIGYSLVCACSFHV